MWRKVRALALAAGLGGCMLGGCMHVDGGPETGGCAGHWGRSSGPPAVPGVQGAYGQKVPMAAPYTAAPPQGAMVAQQMMSRSVPLSMVQMNGSGVMPASFPAPPGAAPPPAVMPPGGILSPPGVPFAPGMPGPMHSPFPPGMMPPGAMGHPGMGHPGMGHPGMGHPGMGHPGMPGMGRPGVVAALPPGPSLNPLAGTPRFASQRTQIRFTKPAGMKIAWLTQGPDGRPVYANPPLETPGKYNFLQGAIYQLKLSSIEGRPGVEIYPTLEVVPSNYKTEEFLAHSYVPIEFTQEDFKQIVEGNYVTKVIYLPDPQFQELAGTGTGEIVSTRLEPGVNPINEALRRGSILLVIRMGSIDREAPNTPPLTHATPPRQHLPPGFHGMGMMPGLPPGVLPPGGPGLLGMRPPAGSTPGFAGPNGATTLPPPTITNDPTAPPPSSVPPPPNAAPGVPGSPFGNTPAPPPAGPSSGAFAPRNNLSEVGPPPPLSPDAKTIRPTGTTPPVPMLPDVSGSQSSLRQFDVVPASATQRPQNHRK